MLLPPPDTPLQSFNFWKVPVQHQLLVVNSATIVDAAFMSWARNQDVSSRGFFYEEGGCFLPMQMMLVDVCHAYLRKT